MKSNSLELKNLVVGRHGQPLTSPINATLNSGDGIIVQGKNGAGKSTFLKTVAGLLRPVAGTIQWSDNAPNAIVFIGHKRALINELSVFDNVAYWAKFTDTPELIDAALHYFDLTPFQQLSVNELSAGWQMRVALTRLITMAATLWLLDEPFANLDAEGIGLVDNLIKARLEQGGKLILTTHHYTPNDRLKDLFIKGLN